jgi:hypothetical protein
MTPPLFVQGFKMEATVAAVESMRLLELDSQEKIRAVAEKLAGFCRE